MGLLRIPRERDITIRNRDALGLLAQLLEGMKDRVFPRTFPLADVRGRCPQLAYRGLKVLVFDENQI